MGNSKPFECVLETYVNIGQILDTFLLCNFIYTHIQQIAKIKDIIAFNFILYFLAWSYTYEDPNLFPAFLC